MSYTNVNKDELAGALVWSTLNQRDPELTSPYGDNNPPVGDTRKTWGDMTDEEKGALLLAEHEGKVIEVWCGIDGWRSPCTLGSYRKSSYRIKPEPKRETVTMFGQQTEPNSWNWITSATPWKDDTHRITFDLIDGKPDRNSINMDEV